MKQKYWRIAILLALLALTAFLLGFAFWPVNEGPPTLPPTGNASSQTTTAAASYYLKEYEGKVAAFEAGKSEPLEVLDVYTENLPEGDRAQLQGSGIPAADKEALRRLIEDYGG